MRVGVDLDECIYPFVKMWRMYAGVEVRDAECWNFFELDGYDVPTYLKVYESGVNDRVILRYGQPIEGSIEALHQLRADGHTIHIITDRFVGQHAQENTEYWLEKHAVPYDSLTYAKDKTVLNVSAYIDDKPANVDAMSNVGVLAFLLDRGRTDQAGHMYAITSWERFVKIVREIDDSGLWT